MDYNRRRATLAGLLGAVAFASGMGLEPLWPVAWIAALPVLAVAPRVPVLRAVVVALTAWLLGYFPFWNFLVTDLRVPRAIAALTIVLPGLVFALVVLVFRAFVRREAPWSAALCVPALWVAFELALTRLSPHGSAGSFAYTQADVLPIAQLASVTGLSGITFLLMAVPAAAAVARRRLEVAIAAALLVATALAFGTWRLAQPAPGTVVTVGLAASDASIGAFRSTDRGEALAVLEAHVGAVDALAARGATVVVLPEKIVGVTEAYRGDVEQLLRDAATRNRVTLVAGVNEIATPLRRNVALVVAPDGTVAGRYLKRHHIPGIEAGYLDGDGPLVVPATAPPWGVAICKDLDFPALGREYAGRGSGLLLVPAWDFVSDAWLHDRMAAMRGIESGFALARTAKQGLLTVRDARGRLVAVTRSDAAPMTLLATSVEVRHDPTVYARYGDWFAWLCAAVAAGLMIRLGVRGGAARESLWTPTA